MFEIGDRVWKEGAGYAGPGIVVGVFAVADGSLRYNVAHTIEGGRGQFVHIYSAAQLQPQDAA